jgi:hypothetical protein
VIGGQHAFAAAPALPAACWCVFAADFTRRGKRSRATW